MHKTKIFSKRLRIAIDDRGITDIEFVALVRQKQDDNEKMLDGISDKVLKACL